MPDGQQLLSGSPDDVGVHLERIPAGIDGEIHQAPEVLALGIMCRQIFQFRKVDHGENALFPYDAIVKFIVVNIAELSQHRNALD